MDNIVSPYFFFFLSPLRILEIRGEKFREFENDKPAGSQELRESNSYPLISATSQPFDPFVKRHVAHENVV